MILDLRRFALHKAAFQIAFQIIAVFFPHGGIVWGSGIPLLLFCNFRSASLVICDSAVEA